MPPKKPDDLKNRKKPDEKAPGGKKEPQKKPQKDGKEKPPKDESQQPRRPADVLKLCLANRFVQVFALFVIVALLLIIAQIFTLYSSELKRLADKYRAVTRIRNAMVQYNESFQDHDEKTAIEGAEQVAEDLQRLQRINEQVQKSIDEVIEKLKENWVPFNGYLYYFDERDRIFELAASDCNQRKSYLVYIRTPEEQLKDFFKLDGKGRRPKREFPSPRTISFQPFGA